MLIAEAEPDAPGAGSEVGEPHSVNQEWRHRRKAIGSEHERGPEGPHEQGRRVHTRTSIVARLSPRIMASSPVIGVAAADAALARTSVRDGSISISWPSFVVSTNLERWGMSGWPLRPGRPSVRSR